MRKEAGSGESRKERPPIHYVNGAQSGSARGPHSFFQAFFLPSDAQVAPQSALPAREEIQFSTCVPVLCVARSTEVRVASFLCLWSPLPECRALRRTSAQRQVRTDSGRGLPG